MPLLRSLPKRASFEHLRSAHGGLLEKLRPYAAELMRGPSELSPGERELIAAFVSGLNACRYCHGTHARVASMFGIDAATLAALLDDVDSAPIEPRLRPVMRYVAKLTVSPSRLTRADAEAVHAAGLGEEGLMRAIAVCAYFNQMNRLVEGAGVRGTSTEHERAAQRLFATGYGGESPCESR